MDKGGWWGVELWNLIVSVPDRCPRKLFYDSCVSFTYFQNIQRKS